MHAWPKALIGILGLQIWIVNSRRLVSKVLRNCIHCYDYKPHLLDQIMGSLPADRLSLTKPFAVTGVDLCGPFLTSYRIRGKAPYKTYMAVFVCFATKAVHVELVSDLSTNTFILCLKRFIGRRSLPNRIFCDNATNFFGTRTQLEEFKMQLFSQQALKDLQMFTSSNGVEFSFIPPRAPHFGGLWEAAVKSMKLLLVKNTGHSHLTYEELQTVAVDAEAVVNSRPLAPLSEDPNDGEALTPSHFLVGTSLKALPEPSLEECNLSHLTRWQRVTHIKQQFWELWRRDYLHTLHARSKWLSPKANIVPGQVVMIHEDNASPQQWPLGRITNTCSGADERVRVVDIKTAKGVIRRPIPPASGKTLK
ncbi:uncharacterized protein [Drosophila suzukii]|uniref:Integrase catalytic domain-containing protein n=1 Tax=Drosophila suzukii TaxID=28584 RepID=A0ABM4TW99_DROSZ